MTTDFACNAEQFRGSTGPAAVPLHICCVATLLRRPADSGPTAFPCLATLMAEAASVPLLGTAGCST